MQNAAPLILLVFSFVFFCIAVARVSQPEYPKLIALGLAFWVFAELIGGGIKVYLGHQ